MSGFKVELSQPIGVNAFHQLQTTEPLVQGLVSSHREITCRIPEDFVSSPGYTAPFYLIPRFFSCIKEFLIALGHRDKDGMIEFGVQLLNIPIGVTAALERYAIFAMMLLLGLSITPLSLSALILGLVFEALEFCIELYRTVRLLLFDKEVSPRECIQIIEDLNMKGYEQSATGIQKIKKALKKHKETLKAGLNDTEFQSYWEKICNDLNQIELSLETIRKTPKDLAVYNRERDKINQRNFSLRTSVKDLQTLFLFKKVEHLFFSYLYFSQSDIRKASHLARKMSHSTSPSEQDMEKAKEQVLAGKLSALARKVRPYNVVFLQKKIPLILDYFRFAKNSKDYEEAIELTKDVFKQIDEQTTKAFLVHAVGLASVFVVVTTFLASFFLAPPLGIIIALTTAGFIFEFGRFFAPDSFLDHPGWNWDWSPWVPNCVYEYLGEEPPEPLSESVKTQATKMIEMQAMHARA